VLLDDPFLFEGLHFLFHLSDFSFEVKRKFIDFDGLGDKLLLLEHLLDAFFETMILAFASLFLKQRRGTSNLWEFF
jgi:hypothetical protein